MRAGNLRYEVILERRTDSQDAGGEVLHTYTEFARDFASIEDLSSREFASVAQVMADATTRIRMRWRNDIDTTCRIRQVTDYDSPGRTIAYDVLGEPTVDVKTGRREMTLLCAKREAEGWRNNEN
jgi:head-tail adaptor